MINLRIHCDERMYALPVPRKHAFVGRRHPPRPNYQFDFVFVKTVVTIPDDGTGQPGILH